MVAPNQLARDFFLKHSLGMTARELKLTDPRSLRAYAHPLRLSLIGLLRSQGPMTATQAAAELGDSVPNCSFHLRQLAKYGLVERAAGADARERPWRATAMSTSWDDNSDDPELRAATDQLNTVVLGQYLRYAEEYLARRHEEPTEWRSTSGFGDWLVHLTAAELKELNDQVEALYARYDDRLLDPSRRPAGSRPVKLVQLIMPRPGKTVSGQTESGRAVLPLVPSIGPEADRD